VIALLGLMAGQAHAAPKPDLTAVNLALSDLPPGFTLKSDISRTNAQATKAGGSPVAQENAEGRLLSDDADYTSQNLVGMIEVESIAVLYRSPANAAAKFKADQIKSAKLPAPFKPMSVGPLGAGRFAFIATVKKKNISITVIEMLFVRGPYEVSVEADGFTNTFTPNQVYKLAMAVDGHILKRG
jgi:hypothetical protein